MKRSEMLLKLQEMMIEAPSDIEQATESILTRLEKAGMAPPCVDDDRCQAIMRVYYDSTFNRWDEDFDKDEKLVAAYKRRMSLK